MKCPNCGYLFENGRVCQKCNSDIYLYIKTVNASTRLYNKALELAQTVDLSEAEINLEKSIEFNKYNVDARNLLGIVYLEKGKVGDALKEWVISSSIKKENNRASEYVENLYKNARSMDKMNDAVRMYNKSIVHIKNGSVDLAIIGLKKALGFNKKLVDAYNLLGLCYIETKKYNTAKKYLNKAIKIDSNNEITKKYISYINSLNKSNKNNPEDVEIEDNTDKKNNLTYREHKKRFSPIGRGEIIAFLIGGICTTLLLFTLVVPSMVENRDNHINNLTNSLNENGVEGSKNDIDSLIKENDTLKNQVNELQNKVDSQENMSKLDNAISLMNDGNYLDSANTLLNINKDLLSDEYISKYEETVQNLYPKVSKDLFNDGKRDFINNNFSKAQISLENCLKFANGEDFVDDTIYYLGKIAEKNSDFETAKLYYERVLSEFPNSNQAINAENSINNILNSQ